VGRYQSEPALAVDGVGLGTRQYDGLAIGDHPGVLHRAEADGHRDRNLVRLLIGIRNAEVNFRGASES